jgi:hypothetical protein
VPSSFYQGDSQSQIPTLARPPSRGRVGGSPHISMPFHQIGATNDSSSSRVLRIIEWLDLRSPLSLTPWEIDRYVCDLSRGAGPSIRPHILIMTKVSTPDGFRTRHLTLVRLPPSPSGAVKDLFRASFLRPQMLGERNFLALTSPQGHTSRPPFGTRGLRQ